MTSESDVSAALSRTKDKFGKLDAVVNCAGIGVAFKTYNFNKGKAHQQEDFNKVNFRLNFKKLANKRNTNRLYLINSRSLESCLK